MIKNNSPEVLGLEIINLARSQLLVNFRFLDKALVLLDTRKSEDVSFLTDGRTIYYDPWYILHLYKSDNNVINRNYLHLLLHLIFKHSYINKNINKYRWNLACDIAVELIIDDLDKPFLNAKRTLDQKELINELKKANTKERNMNAENIYALLEELNISDEDLEKLDEYFFGDSHALWYEDNNTKYSKDIDVVIKWEEISKRMQVELELLEKNKNSLLAKTLKDINRVKRDYDDFLRKFMIHSEVLKVSDEEFDNNYYSYGLKLYGNMPIIESLEYSLDKRLKDFVIAIDTSGSISIEVAQKFIEHTASLLSNGNTFSNDANIHIIQCDDRVREDALIKNKEDLDKYLENITIKGLGETDFRPVFNYVEDLIKKGELRNLKGLLYFTDGDGIFPKEVPNFETAFIIHADKMYESVKVPMWAMKFELDEKDIINGDLFN